MLRYLSIPLLCICGAFVTAAPRDFGILGGKARVGTGSGFINGISIATLYDGYWTGMPEAIIHDPGVNNVAATDLDPLQTSFGWMVDTVTNASLFEAQVGYLRTEWSTASNKFAGTIDRTFYVDPTDGSNLDDGLTEGNAWATLLYAVNTVGVGNGTATRISLMPGVHYIEANPSDIGSDDPSGGAATVKVNNYAGTAADPLIIEWQSGASVRIGHTFMAANFADIRDGTGGVGLNAGIQVGGTSSYVEFWDPVMVGPMFELVYTDGSGDCVGIHMINGSNIKVIGGEITQWTHCGIKAKDIEVYGTYVHNNGAASGGIAAGHDHGIYLTGDGVASVIEGCLIVGNYTNGINPRDYSDSGLVVRGNILGWNGGFGGNVGGFGTTVEHNTFVNNNLGGLLWGDDSAGLIWRNNAIYETNIDTIGLGGAYTRPIGFVWTTNAKLAAASTSSIPAYTAWTTSTTVPRPASTYYGANNYYNQVSASAATGATPPTHTSGSVSDGTITWRYVGAAGAESFGTFTTIDADDFADFANFDFRPATVSDLKANGTDIGYGTTIGPFSTSP